MTVIKSEVIRRMVFVIVAAVSACLVAHAAEKETAMTPLTLTSSAFAANHPIPKKHTGEGPDLSPALKWEGAPDRHEGFLH